MGQKLEIITKAVNSRRTAQYGDYIEVWTSPSDPGWTREKALVNVAFDETYLTEYCKVEEWINPEE